MPEDIMIKIIKMEEHLANQDDTIKRIEKKIDAFTCAIERKAERGDVIRIQDDIQRIADIKANKDDYVFLRNLVIITMIASIFMSLIISSISKYIN